MIGIIYPNFINIQEIKKTGTSKIRVKKLIYKNDHLYLVADGAPRLSQLIKEGVVKFEEDLFKIAEVVENTKINLEEYFHLVKINKVQNFIIENSPYRIYDKETFYKYDRLYSLSQELKHKTSIKVLLTLINSRATKDYGGYLNGNLFVKDDILLLEGNFYQTYESSDFVHYEPINNEIEVIKVRERYKVTVGNFLDIICEDFDYSKINPNLEETLISSFLWSLKSDITVAEGKERKIFEDFDLSKEAKGLIYEHHYFDWTDGINYIWYSFTSKKRVN